MLPDNATDQVRYIYIYIHIYIFICPQMRAHSHMERRRDKGAVGQRGREAEGRRDWGADSEGRNEIMLGMLTAPQNFDYTLISYNSK